MESDIPYNLPTFCLYLSDINELMCFLKNKPIFLTQRLLQNLSNKFITFSVLNYVENNFFSYQSFK